MKMRGKFSLRRGCGVPFVIFILLISTFLMGFKNKELKDVTFQEAEVIKITDGDTIEVKVNGNTEKIRLILIDAPESVHPNKEKEFFSKESSEFAEKVLSGKRVWLQKDVSDRDRYGRLLRYVWLEKPDSSEPSISEFREKCFNGMAVAEGYASIVTYPPDVFFENYILELQKEARENGSGLWNLEAENESSKDKKAYTKNPVILTKTVKNKNGTTFTADVTEDVIKGNKKSKIYHMPGDRDYDNMSIKNTVYFSSEEEAISSGYRKSKR